MNLHLHSDQARRPLVHSLMVQRARRHAVPSPSRVLAYALMIAGIAAGALVCVILFTPG